MDEKPELLAVELIERFQIGTVVFRPAKPAKTNGFDRYKGFSCRGGIMHNKTGVACGERRDLSTMSTSAQELGSALPHIL